MKPISSKFNEAYAPPIREHNMPLNVQMAGVTKPVEDYYADIVATDYEEGCYQFEYVTGGKGYITIEGKTTPVTKGDFFFINKYVHRVLSSDRENPLQKIFVCVSGEFIDGIIKAYEMDVPLVVCKSNVSEYIYEIIRIAKEAPGFESDILDNIGDEIIKIVRKIYRERSLGTVSEKRNNIAESVMFYIQSNFTRRFSIEDMTDAFFICKTQLIKQFKSHYGTTPMKYTQQKRIEASKHYLANTDVPITKIHEKVGFSDPKYFSLAFKASTGICPREYRNMQKGM